MSIRFTLTEALGTGARDAAAAALHAHNAAQTGIADRRPIAAVALDADTGGAIGGMWGRTELGLLFLEMFHLPEALRGQGAGGTLLGLVEAEARRRGCLRAVVKTSTFQAPGSYVRHGYAEFGRIPFGTRGHERVFLREDLAGPGCIETQHQGLAVRHDDAGARRAARRDGPPVSGPTGSA